MTHRTFALQVKIKRHIFNFIKPTESQWFFICTYCKNIFQPVTYTRQIKSMIVRMFQEDWKSDIDIAIYSGNQTKPWLPCGKGQYYIAPHRDTCDPGVRQYLAISGILNVTFVELPASTFRDHKWGFNHLNYGRRWYPYSYVNILYSFRYEGYHAINCDFDVWSEKSDFKVWLSPFAIEVWLVSLAFVFIARILKGILQFQRNPLNLKLLRTRAELVFPICVEFRKQLSYRNVSSIWITVSLFFTGSVLLWHYELYLTANLIAPSRYNILHTLSEFFSNQYTLVYPSEEMQGVVSVRSQLQDEFVWKSLGYFPHEKPIITRFILSRNE